MMESMLKLPKVKINLLVVINAIIIYVGVFFMKNGSIVPGLYPLGVFFMQMGQLVAYKSSKLNLLEFGL